MNSEKLNLLWNACIVRQQVVQSCRYGPPLGGQGLAKRCGLASVLPGLSQPFGGWAHVELADSSWPWASPQHQQEVPPGQLAAGHRTAAPSQFRQGGKQSVHRQGNSQPMYVHYSTVQSFSRWNPPPSYPDTNRCLHPSQALQARRIQCEHQNVDPLVWTSHRVTKWIRDIDLKVGMQKKKFHLQNCTWEKRFTLNHISALWKFNNRKLKLQVVACSPCVYSALPISEVIEGLCHCTEPALVDDRPFIWITSQSCLFVLT